MRRLALASALALAACGTNITLGTLPADEGAIAVPGDEMVDASTFDACVDDVCELPSWDAAADDGAAEIDDAGLGDAALD